jgi:hypothetical protein
VISIRFSGSWAIDADGRQFNICGAKLMSKRQPTASFDDLNKLCCGTNATPEDIKEICQYNTDDGFEAGTWDNEKRQAYL